MLRALFILPLTGEIYFHCKALRDGVRLSVPCPYSAHAGDPSNTTTGQMGDGSYTDAMSPHIPKARRKRRSPGLLWREREDYLMKLHGGTSPETRLFLIRQQPRQWPVRTCSAVPCRGLQASSARANVAPEQRAPRHAGRAGIPQPRRGLSIQPEPSIRPRLGNCTVQVPLPHAEHKRQPYPSLAEGDA